MNRVLCVVIIVMLVACGVLSLGLNHYRDNAITYKAQRDKKVSELKLANATITDLVAPAVAVFSVVLQLVKLLISLQLALVNSGLWTHYGHS